MQKPLRREDLNSGVCTKISRPDKTHETVVVTKRVVAETGVRGGPVVGIRCVMRYLCPSGERERSNTAAVAAAPPFVTTLRRIMPSDLLHFNHVLVRPVLPL